LAKYNVDPAIRSRQSMLPPPVGLGGIDLPQQPGWRMVGDSQLPVQPSVS
jgi:hypothetical protein